MFLILEDTHEEPHLTYVIRMANVVLRINPDGKTFAVLKHRWVVNYRKSVPIEQMGAWLAWRDGGDGPQ